MKTNSNNYRRAFLKKCVAITAGASLFGSGIKLMASPTNPTDDWSHIGFCGAKCDNSCSAFSGHQCPGCNKTNPGCSIGKCAVKKQIPTCAHCDELDTCDDSFWTDNPNAKIRVQELRDSLGLTGIDMNESSEQEINIFPNPVQDYLKIQNHQNSFFNYELADINGQILKKGNFAYKELTINVSDLNPGTYLFKLIRNNNVLRIQKVIKL